MPSVHDTIKGQLRPPRIRAALRAAYIPRSIVILSSRNVVYRSIIRPRDKRHTRFVETERRHMRCYTRIHDNTSFTGRPLRMKSAIVIFPLSPLSTLKQHVFHDTLSRTTKLPSGPSFLLVACHSSNFGQKRRKGFSTIRREHRPTIRAYLRVFFENPSNVTQKCGFRHATRTLFPSCRPVFQPSRNPISTG